MEPIYYREALAWMRAHPIDWIGLELRKVFYLVVPIGPSYRVHSPRYYLRVDRFLRVCCCPSRSRVAAARTRAEPDAGTVAAGRLGGPRLPGVLPAGAFPHSRDRSRARRARRHAVASPIDRGRPRMKLLIVMPTYNERPNLERVTAGILSHDFARLLIVDDASPDGTGAIADELAARHPGRVQVLHRKGPRGLGLAYVDGLEARARRATPTRSARWTPTCRTIPSYLPDLVARLDRYDLVIGSRYLHGISVVNWPLHRIALSAFANRYIRAVTGLSAADCTSAYRVWRTRGAGAGAARPRARQRLRVPDGDAVRGDPPRLPHRRGADRLRRTAGGLLEGVDARSCGVALTPWRLLFRGGRAPKPPAGPDRCDTSSSWSPRRIPAFPGTASAASWSRSRKAWPRAGTKCIWSRRGIRPSRGRRWTTASTFISSTTRRCRRCRSSATPRDCARTRSCAAPRGPSRRWRWRAAS